MGKRVKYEGAENHAHMARASSFDPDVAMERGRLFAARCIIDDPEARKRVESVLGVPYCQMRWPEAYAKGEWKPVVKHIPGFGDVPA